MNKITIIFLIAGALTSCRHEGQDSVKQAHYTNLNAAIDERISEFLTEAADARMADIERGKLAQTRGSNDAVRNYGAQMVRDHERMLQELRVLAAQKNIVLPIELSNEKARQLEKIREKEGNEFDAEFLEVMTADHRRDVKKFEDATDLKDKDVRQFAERYLPVAKAHLENVRAIRESNAVAQGEQEAE
jgi:putative membrane protein